jgi:2-phospho-L-lactate guanylyltransferase (CobY/MobA/RfbA family)
MLSAKDVAQLLASDGDVVIARSFDGGTNGLLLRSLIAPAFGVLSAHEHAARARRAGLSCRVLDIPGFARDIDDAASLTAYGASFLRPRS